MFRISVLFLLFISFFLASFYLIKNHNSKALAQVCSTSNVDVVLVIDRSGSMTDPAGGSGTKFQYAKIAAKRFVNILENSGDTRNRVGIASYASYGSIDRQVSGNYQAARTAIDALRASGDTCIECGIYRGNLTLRDNGRAGNKKIVVLLTDGRANITQTSQPTLVSQTNAENAALDEARRWNRNEGTIYYTIGLGNDINRSFLRDVARIGGGRYYDSPTTNELEGIFERIANEILATGSISGFAFEDSPPPNGVYDIGERKLPNWVITLTNPDGTTTTKTTDARGNYTFSSLCNGSYRIKQTIPAGYVQTRPGNPNGFTLTISGDPITNINFGAAKTSTETFVSKWVQSVGGDIREDRGRSFQANVITAVNQFFSQASTIPTRLLSHGVVFLTRPFNLGALDQSTKANESRWMITDVEFARSLIYTRYSEVLKNLTRGGVMGRSVNLFGGPSSPCRNNFGPSCNLDPNLGDGIYTSDGTVTINEVIPRYDFDPNSDYIFLIDGDLNILSNLQVPPGSTAIFIVNGDIKIGSDVTRIDGIFSADNKFIVDGTDPDTDEQLIINGSVIANTRRQDIQAFENNRDLGNGNAATPAVQIIMRPDFVLHVPLLMRAGNFDRKEVAPGQ